MPALPVVPGLVGRRALVIGAGVGGLAASIRLAAAGLRVRLVERAAHLGGRLREVEVGGRRIGAGPSVLTMRWVFEELFAGRMGEYLTLEPLEPLCRHFFADGAVLDLFTDEERSREAIARMSGERAARGYVAWRKHAAKIYEIVRGPFMENPVPSLWGMMSPRALWQMTQIDGTRTLWKALEEFFPDERLRALFGRYATYNGSSPYHAPATLAVIAHVENAGGIWACRGGIGRLAEALAARARELGVEIATGVEVERLVVEGGRVVGARLQGGGEERADVVVSNADAHHVYGRLLEGVPAARALDDKYVASELSLSAFVLLAVARRAPLDLAHHNVFFSGDYKREFVELVDQGRPPEDPTVYLCADDRAPGHAPGGAAIDDGTERAFFLTNAAPLDRAGAKVDWSMEAKRCRDRVARTLARHGWTLETIAEEAVTPPVWDRLFPSSRGALYGLSSNSAMAAFKRPPNRVGKLAGLYLCGGSVHPGAGMPMVALSARIAVGQALEDLARGG